MHQEILINVEAQEKRVAILENKILEELYVERESTHGLVGNIYKGVVETVVPAIGAAFVTLGLEKNGFLYVQDITAPDYEKIAELIEKPGANAKAGGTANRAQGSSNIKDLFRPGQEILVQVTKEPLGKKGPRLTTHISLPGRCLVLMPQDGHLGISRRIQDNKERGRLRDILRSLRIDNMGLIVRTAASGATRKAFLQDLRYLTNLWRKVKLTLRKQTAPCLIHEEYDLVLRIIRDRFSAQTSLWVDAREEYKKIMRFLGIFAPSLRTQVHFYQSDVPLFEKHTVEDQIVKVYERKVSLSSGGYIMLEPTEALVAIDVNSAKFTSQTNPEETAYQVNLEAAKEIARQLRLRDIGGIIIIDFIDMRQPAHKQKVFNALSEALKRDYAKTDISAVSELGLIQMTRQRTRRSLEHMFFRPCPYCQGKGMLKSPATMAVVALRKMKKMLLKVRSKTILIFAHPEVALYLVNEHRQSIYNLERQFSAKVLVRQDANLRMDELKFETV